MSEKVVHEIQIVETDEGFRIELKGDKEELRRMIFGGQGAPFGEPFAGREWRFGPFAWHGPFGGHRHGPFGHGAWRHHHESPPPFEHGAPPPPEEQEDVLFFKHHKPKRRRFGARWEASWGYDLGPWWDEGMTPTDEPPADV